jgi:hypothetical protein
MNVSCRPYINNVKCIFDRFFVECGLVLAEMDVIFLNGHCLPLSVGITMMCINYAFSSCPEMSCVPLVSLL